MCFGLLFDRFSFLLMLYRDFLLPSHSLLNFSVFLNVFLQKQSSLYPVFSKTADFSLSFAPNCQFSYCFAFKLTVSPPEIECSPPESLLPPGAKSLLDLVFLQAHLPATKLNLLLWNSLGKTVCHHHFCWTVSETDFLALSKIPDIMVLNTYMLGSTVNKWGLDKICCRL